MCMHMCGYRHDAKCLWQSEGNLMKFSPSTTWVLGIKLKSSGLAVSTFIHWVIQATKSSTDNNWFFLKLHSLLPSMQGQTLAAKKSKMEDIIAPACGYSPALWRFGCHLLHFTFSHTTQGLPVSSKALSTSQGGMIVSHETSQISPLGLCIGAQYINSKD